MTTREIPGPYRLLGLLGRGGMGSVYTAQDERLGRRVAVKRIPADVATDLAKRQRFRREAATLARLSHPSIVQIFDLIETDEGDWIVMELVEGPTLAEVLDDGPLELSRVLAIGRQVAEGLAEAHAQGVLHRDLKAENVILDQRGSGEGIADRPPADRVKILDFGLAKPLEPGEGEPSLSVSGQVLGTYRAMSPEQVLGLPLDRRSDLFSLGVLLYELSTGERPWSGETPFETMSQIVRHPHVSVRASRPEIPMPLAAFIDRLLEKSPEARPAGAAEVVEELATLGDESRWRRPGESTAARIADESTLVDAPPLPASRDESPKRASRPRRGLWALAAMLFAATLLATFGRGLWTGGDPPTETALPTAVGEPAESCDYAHFREGMGFLDRFDKPGHLDRAMLAFEAAIECNPRSAPAHAGIALAHSLSYARDRDPPRLERAAEEAQRAVALDGHLAFARVVWGKVLVQSGRLPEAIEEFETALVLDPSNARAQEGLGDVHALEGRLGDAITAMARAVELEPRDRALRDRLGELYFQAARYAEAEAQFQASIELAPDGIYGHRNLAAVYYMQGRFAEAAQAIQEALAIKPEHSLYSNLGTLLFAQKLYPAAAEAFEKAIELGGEHYYLYWANLGDAHRLSGREAEARRAYSRAIELIGAELETTPESEVARSRLALYLAKSGACGRSLAELDARPPRAGEKGPGDLYRTAVAHEVCGRRAEALEALGAALAAGFSRREVEGDPELAALRTDPRFQELAGGPPVPVGPTTISGST